MLGSDLGPLHSEKWSDTQPFQTYLARLALLTRLVAVGRALSSLEVDSAGRLELAANWSHLLRLEGMEVG